MSIAPHDTLGAELARLADEDLALREELAADGSLFEGYHPRMEALHGRNAARLREQASALRDVALHELDHRSSSTASD